MSQLHAPFGSWPSKLRARDVAAAALLPSYATAVDGRLYWIESRPNEGGRGVLVSVASDGVARDVSGAADNVRSCVHEYGGQPYGIAGGAIVACDFRSQRLQLRRVDGPAGFITPEGFRYADFAAGRGATLYAVREDHTRPGEPVNAIVELDVAQPSAGHVLFDRSDFVAYPRPANDGRIAFIAWNHPNMPWDATRLYVGTPGRDGLDDLEVVSGGEDESVLEPIWDSDGALYFLSDRSGWWNLHRWRDRRIEAVTALEADFGGPLWNLGISTYALTGNGSAVARVCRNAVDELVRIDLASGRIEPLQLPYVAFSSVGLLDPDTGFAIASSETAMPAIITYSLRDNSHRVLRGSDSPLLAPKEVSRAEQIHFPTHLPDGTKTGAFGFFYAPRNPHVAAPPDARPPLVVLLHGGPTSHAPPAFGASIQYWTSRGFAVVNVNYGGSSGYGRAYRNRLLGQWGVVDLADAVAAVDYLVAQGRVDGARVVIRGGSAGGFTVLAGLAFTRRFAAGINYFGVADLEALAAETHKFESRYLDRLVAPLPEGRPIYRARSPIHHLEALDAALITFQGSEDRAVPPEQSRSIVAAVRARGRPVAYLEFQGEQHGFRRAENIARALEAELYFLGRIFAFTPADSLEPVAIDNLPDPDRTDRG